MSDSQSISTGCDRLTLQNENGFFRALVWSSEVGREWRLRAVITHADFKAGSDHERWISGLHSFDPATGLAIIKVGQTIPLHKTFSKCDYSWREWDLSNNRELRLLRMCEDPSEEYSDSAPPPESGNSVVIDCKEEGWDGILLRHLFRRRHIEIRNLHSSYASYMKQLAETSFMEFVGHFEDNRGEFKPREAS